MGLTKHQTQLVGPTFWDASDPGVRCHQAQWLSLRSSQHSKLGIGLGQAWDVPTGSNTKWRCPKMEVRPKKILVENGIHEHPMKNGWFLGGVAPMTQDFSRILRCRPRPPRRREHPGAWLSTRWRPRPPFPAPGPALWPAAPASRAAAKGGDGRRLWDCWRTCRRRGAVGGCSMAPVNLCYSVCEVVKNTTFFMGKSTIWLVVWLPFGLFSHILGC